MLKSKCVIYLLLLCLIGCVSEFNAQLPTSDKELLIVTSDIIADMEVVFSLSKSIPLSGKSPKNHRDIEAKIIITDSDGYRSNPDKAIGEDKYQVSIGELQNNVSYGVEIEYNGEIYVSSPPEPMEIPEMGSVSWIQPVREQPLTIQVFTHGDPGKIQYYMWNYREDWEIRANYMTTCHFDPETDHIYEDDDYPILYYWKKELSKSILTSLTQLLKESQIISNKLFETPVKGDRSTVLCNILVQQWTLSKAGYEYYLSVQQQDKDMGGIFTPQSSEVQGNLSCTIQPERGVISYVGAYEDIVEKRICTRSNNIERSFRYTDYEKLTDDDLNEVGCNTYLTRYLTGYRLAGTGIYIDNWTPQKCTECECNGGNKNKPSLWPNDHQ